MVVPESDTSGRIVTLVMPLDGLDQEASRKILTTMKDLDMPQFLHIHNLSRGHPLVLELINRGSVGGTFHETLEAFVEKEIFSRLSGAEKRLLGANWWYSGAYAIGSNFRNGHGNRSPR